MIPFLLQAVGATAFPIQKINAYAFPATTYGATVTAADIDSDGVGGYLDGYDEIVVGKGPGPANDTSMRVFDYGDGGAFTISRRWPVPGKEPIVDTASRYGLNVAGGDVDAGDTQEIATAPGPDPAALGRSSAGNGIPTSATSMRSRASRRSAPTTSSHSPG